jgi:hypothetical protein
MNAANTSLSTELIIRKAKFFAEKFKVFDFCGSNGWFDRFKHRYELKKIKLHGEANSVGVGTINAGKILMQKELEHTNPNLIFNMDESELFYNLKPNTTFSFEAIKGIKKINQE